MTLTLEELKKYLAEQLDEVDLLDQLGVTSFQLVERFADVIEENFEKFEKLVEPSDTNDIQETED